jgi:predicted metalloprotease with PDZ domain
LYGLRFDPQAPDARAKAWLDVVTRVDDGRLLVSALDARFERYQPGDKVTLLVSRRGELRRFGLTLGSAPTNRWSLSVNPDATREQQRRLTAWLGDMNEARGKR